MKLEFDFGKFIPIKDAFQGAGFEKLKRSLLTLMVRQKDMAFKAETDPDGNKWASLSKKTASARTKGQKDSKFGHKILQDSGTLKNSLTTPGAPYMAEDIGANEVSLGTNVPYAAIQQFGGTVSIPVIKNGFGLEIEIPAHTVVIPARPFIGFGEQDDEQVTEKIEAFIKKGDVA